MTELWLSLTAFTVVALFLTGFMALIIKAALIKVLLGLELLGKAATLTFILGGFLMNDLGRAQAIVFTVIVIEVIVAALALALMVNVYRTTGTLSVRGIRRLRG
jgi:multisubunit Na+/H+ antiporter MnhC subunit